MLNKTKEMRLMEKSKQFGAPVLPHVPRLPTIIPTDGFELFRRNSHKDAKTICVVDSAGRESCLIKSKIEKSPPEERVK